MTNSKSVSVENDRCEICGVYKARWTRNVGNGVTFKYCGRCRKKHNLNRYVNIDELEELVGRPLRRV